MVTKYIAYNKKFALLKIGLRKCQYLGALSPIRLWNHPIEHGKPIVGSNFTYQMG